ncbi:hypothetical protein [Acidisphaera sp. S103]|uniref:hypothetical protein n=1 Tax=Acidisphaera sp. S103 TaxID=1747223 RepID=UPI00131E9B1A|nr:hypothetical protein [Acidisphaera sp. S103]
MANARQWSLFQARLNAMKRQYGFRVFHGKDFKSQIGEFRGWSEQKCRAFLHDFGVAGGDLTEIVNCLLPNADYEQNYRRASGDPKRLRLDTAYALCSATA